MTNMLCWYCYSFFAFCIFILTYLSLHSTSPQTGNFTYKKYNGLVMQLGISKRFKKKKGECIHYEKAD